MRLSQEVHRHNKHPERILQFGEGNFLRAFADWMIDIFNKEADFKSSIVVVQPIENGLVEKLNEQDGLYTLYLNGIKNGQVLREKSIIESISRGINPYKDYDEYLEVAKNPELRFIISNTTEAGIVFDENDKLTDRPQKSFPGKLTSFLFERYKYFKGDENKGLVFLPCELIDKNGDKLKNIVLRYADLWNLGQGFIEWLNGSNIFCNTLVDRIVTGYPKDKIDLITEELGYEDNMVVEGEQFHLWVVEGPASLKDELPVDKTNLNIKFVDDLTPYRTRKVRILNGAHTTMVPVSLLYGLETVKETIEDSTMGQFVKEAIFEEIVPTLDLPEDELNYFANAVLDRFKNPYIKHYLISIALNSNSKFNTRVLPSILEYKKRTGKLPKKLVFALAALIRLYSGKIDEKTIELKDNKEILEMYDELWSNYDGLEEGVEKIVNRVLGEKRIWELDLNDIEGLKDNVTYYLNKIIKVGVKEAIKEVM